jgi:hypothetical protein
MKSFTNIIGYLTALSIALFTIFKFCYIDGAWLVLIVAEITLSIYFLALIPQLLSLTAKGKILPMHIVAAICISILNLAILFKFQHWNASGVLFSLSIASFCLLLIPMVLVHRSEQPGATILADCVGAFGLEAISLGINNKMLHWSGADILFITGFVLIFFIYFPLYIANKTIPSEKKASYLRNAFLLIILAQLFYLNVFGTMMNGT